MRLAALAALSLILSGCYFDRMTSNYDSVFEVTNTDDDGARRRVLRARLDARRLYVRAFR